MSCPFSQIYFCESNEEDRYGELFSGVCPVSVMLPLNIWLQQYAYIPFSWSMPPHCELQKHS